MWNPPWRVFRLRTRLVDQFGLDVNAGIRPGPSSRVVRPQLWSALPVAYLAGRVLVSK